MVPNENSYFSIESEYDQFCKIDTQSYAALYGEMMKYLGLDTQNQRAFDCIKNKLFFPIFLE